MHPATCTSVTTTTTTAATTTPSSCLHCGHTRTSIQVRCDACNAYICNACHWCHEFQAHHEIRVCDRCDAFYCRDCDPMDQCDECAEVTCGACRNSTWLACKFCGGSVCDDCATACGRCGIVLCSRDAKFAVDCDTCHLSYCLVCLASGRAKDPCVRCGHRPSKRMEQLVHLRLKSIYKAFAAHRSSNSSGGSEQPSDPVAVLQAMAAAAAPRIECVSASTDTMTCHQRRSTTYTSSTASSSCGEDMDEQSRPPLLHEYQQAKAKADAAAAELLAELEEEEEAEKSKKTKKKKKKARQQRKKTIEVPPAPSDSTQHNADFICQPIVEDKEEQDDADDTDESTTNAAARIEISTDSAPSPPPDPIEAELEELIEEGDVEGLEDFLANIKGVPGKAMLRKHTKKAIKRLRDPPVTDETPLSPVPEASALLRIVTETSKGKTNRGAFECVLEIAPIIVGWIIGKGGQRIRDLMEDSGARIWIDQDCDADAARTVYVSGQRNQVDTAVGMLLELVDRAPATPSARPTPDGSTSSASWLVHQPGKAAPTMPEASVDDGGAKKQVQSLPLQVKLKPRLGDRGAQEDRCKHILTCEARFVPLLIGRRGWTIKNIQDTTGAKVDIDQNVLPRQITITGNKKSVEEALEMVLDVLSYPHAQPLPDDKLKEHTEAAVSSKPKQPPTVPVAKSIPPLPPSTKPDPHPVSPPEVQKHTVAITPTQQNNRELVDVYSPPSSLVMTSDVRSTISASSSLSSTPEPSMSRVRQPASGPRMALSSPQANREVFTGHNTNHVNLIAPRPHSAAVSMPSHSPLGCRAGIPPSSPAAAAPFLRENEVFGGGQPFTTSLPLQQHPQSLLHVGPQPRANYGGGLPPSFMAQPTTPFPTAVPPRNVLPPATSTTVPLDRNLMLQGQSSFWNDGDLSSHPDSCPRGDAAAAQERDDAQLVDNLFGKSDFLLNGLVSGLSLGGSGLWSQENGPEGMFGREVAQQQQAQPPQLRQQPASRFAWSEHGGN